MQTFSKLTILLTAAIVAACNVTQDNNQSLDYDTLEVNFTATLSGGTWSTGDAIGIVATCTREDETDVAMNTAPISAFAPIAEQETSLLVSKSEEDKIITEKGDHNFKFYAFTPYDGGEINLNSIPADIPKDVIFGKELSQLYVASRTATSVIAPVALEFNTPSCLVKLQIPDDIVNPDGSTVLKSLVLKPVNAELFTGNLAYAASYNIYTGETTIQKGSESKEITVTFGEQGYQMKPGYTTISFLMAPFTVPDGGFSLTFTATDNTVNIIPFLNKNVGGEFAAGSLIEQTMSSSGDGVIPCVSPVEWWIGGAGNHGWQVYPHISTKKLGVFNYDTQPLWKPTVGGYGAYNDDHIWTAAQPQATIQYVYSENHPSPEKIKTETNNFDQYKYSSPCVKGLWTGDYFEFMVPVKKFPANKKVTLTFPAYGRGAPLFWDVDYLDGEEWKTVTKKSHTSPDNKFTKESTLMIPHGNSVLKWDGIQISVEIPFTEAIDSGHLQIRFKVAYGEYITINSDAVGSNECKEIKDPLFDGTSLFAFVNISEVLTSVKLEW